MLGSAMLGVMQHKFVKGVGTLTDTEDVARFGDKGSLHQVMSLGDMLSTTFATDAHFTVYFVTGLPQWPLLRKSVLQEFRNQSQDVLATHMAFDWDNPKTGDQKTPWTEALWNQFVELINTNPDPIVQSWSAMYSTRNGARLIYKLSTPVPVDVLEEHLVWMLRHFRSVGLPLTDPDGWGFDTSCKDWTRRFRCPKVLRDGRPTTNEYPNVCTDVTGRGLDPATLGRCDTRVLAKRRTFNRAEHGTVPTYDVLQLLLHSQGSQGRYGTQTAFYKRAKKQLKSCEYYDYLFDDVPPSWDVGNRNDEILKMLGVITPILMRKCGAKVREIMALAIIPVMCLDQRQQQWPEHTWNALLDIYERETNILNEEEAIKARKASQEQDVLDDMLAGMRSWCKDANLNTEEVLAREFVRNHVLATVKNYYYLMQPNGHYSQLSLNATQVIPRIRKTFLSNLIETTRLTMHGETVDNSIIQLANRHSTPVNAVEMRPMGDVEGYIEDLNGENPRLILSMYRRNPLLTPKFSHDVNNWLKNFLGEQFEKGCEWIGQALAFEDGPICALSLMGNPGAGKKLFVQGLIECLERPYIALGEDLIGQSAALTRTPFLNINEDWPRGNKGTSPADTFKSVTAGDPIIINEKYQPQISVYNPVRCILTSNDTVLLGRLTKGRDMSLDTRIAIGERVLHIDIPDTIGAYMKSIGNRATTAREGARWVAGESGVSPSNYVLARHYLWLYYNRTNKKSTDRFLVYGNCSPIQSGGKDVFTKILTTNTRTALVCLAIQGIVDSHDAKVLQNLMITEEASRLFVTQNGIYQHIKQIQLERVSQGDVTSALQNVMKEKEPEKVNEMDWYEVDLSTLNAFVNRQGIKSTKIRTYYENYRRLNPLPQTVIELNKT